MMKIHAIQTGTVAITTAWREGVGHRRRWLLHTILDKQWTEPLPIYAFAIEHPEGVIVVDTGESASASQSGLLSSDDGGTAGNRGSRRARKPRKADESSEEE